MRRFDRLRKLARKLAAENGHQLGNFLNRPVVFGPPTPRSMPGIFVKPGWYEARCVHCDAEVMFNLALDPISRKGVNVWLAPVEARAMAFALHLNRLTEDGETKLPFPKRAKGAMCGKALSQKCSQNAEITEG